MENIERALSLMGVGMITVFVVLSLVVLAGNLLIRIVNRLSPQAKSDRTDVGQSGKPNADQLSPGKIAAIASAVFHVTGGQGNIEKIEKLK